jgi:insertion element IS1 protein InsB
MTFVLGDKSMQTGCKLWKQIECVPMNHIASGYWSAYENFVPAEKHLQTKRETFTVEGYNCRIRHYLARLYRRTLCYSIKRKNAQLVPKTPHAKTKWQHIYAKLTTPKI